MRDYVHVTRYYNDTVYLIGMQETVRLIANDAYTGSDYHKEILIEGNIHKGSFGEREVHTRFHL